VLEGLDLLESHNCDVIIAIGGGSPIDCAKGISLLHTLGGRLSDYAATTIVSDAITSPLMPLIAMPTTTGSGSEASWGAGLVLPSRGKMVFRSPHLVPAVAICDPELTLALPAHLTAATGVDALSHSLEAFLSPVVNPPADAIALDAARRLSRNLPTAVAHGDSRDARWEVMMGALESAMTTRKGLGAAHALAMPLDETGLHHGTVIAAVLPEALSFVLETADDDRLARLANALDCATAEIVQRVAATVDQVGLNQGLSGLAVVESDLGSMAEAAAESPFNNTSARRGTAEDYARIARRAWRPWASPSTGRFA
jgi:4-hydroxybutyrate dehydrogenase